jgi:formylglycine-generating enzyme required for sulfatase activity
MAGNVAEWCADAFDRRYYAVSPTIDPKGPDFKGARFIDRVRRGGSWQDIPRISERDWSFSDLDAGCRCARDNAP